MRADILFLQLSWAIISGIAKVGLDLFQVLVVKIDGALYIDEP